jgi:hypothetical protein
VAAGLVGHAADLVARTGVADDDLPDHALDRAGDQRGKRARELGFVVSRLDQNGDHRAALAESRQNCQFLHCSIAGERQFSHRQIVLDLFLIGR